MQLQIGHNETTNRHGCRADHDCVCPRRDKRRRAPLLRTSNRRKNILVAFIVPLPCILPYPSSFLSSIPPFPSKCPARTEKEWKFVSLLSSLFFFFSSSLEIRTNIFVGEGNETRIYASSLEFGDEWTSLRKSDRELYFFFFFFPFSWRDKCCFVLPPVRVCVYACFYPLNEI